jgi:hypothetical protein
LTFWFSVDSTFFVGRLRRGQHGQRAERGSGGSSGGRCGSRGTVPKNQRLRIFRHCAAGASVTGALTGGLAGAVTGAMTSHSPTCLFFYYRRHLQSKINILSNHFLSSFS